MTERRATWMSLLAVSAIVACLPAPSRDVDGRKPTTCAPAPPVACTPDDNNSSGACASDADCPDGACVDYYDGCFCGAADCTSDDDCSADFACVCAGVSGMPRNACMPAACRDDDDCGNGRCVLSMGGTDCCDTGEVLGVFCASDADECNGDGDCADEAPSCLFDESAGHFTCGSSGCTCD